MIFRENRGLLFSREAKRKRCAPRKPIEVVRGYFHLWVRASSTFAIANGVRGGVLRSRKIKKRRSEGEKKVGGEGIPADPGHPEGHVESVNARRPPSDAPFSKKDIPNMRLVYSIRFQGEKNYQNIEENQRSLEKKVPIRERYFESEKERKGRGASRTDIIAKR